MTEPGPGATEPAPGPAQPGPGFADLGLDPRLVTALAARGVSVPFAIQTSAIPDALAGSDIAGEAPTGSGKTLAFGLPTIQRVAGMHPAGQRRPHALVLAPTRELAKQIADELGPIASAVRVRVGACYGGMPFEPQIRALERGVELAVATPGRLLDLVRQDLIALDGIAVVVVDEADRLADMGFLPDVEAILGLTPPERQTMLFSATLDGDVDALVRRHQRDPVRHDVAPPELAPVRISLWRADERDRTELTAAIAERVGSCVVFTGTRHGADRLAIRLRGLGVSTESLHGGNSQPKRHAALERFRRGDVTALVATDVAARGIHVDDVGCVVHYDLPSETKDFVHRSGRTGRAGSAGQVVVLVRPTQEVRALEMLRECGIDADLEVEAPDLDVLGSPADRAAFDRELHALASLRRPGSIGSVSFRS